MTAGAFVLAAAVAGWLGARELGRGRLGGGELPEPRRKAPLLRTIARVVGSRLGLALPRETSRLLIAAGVAHHGLDSGAVMGAKAVAAAAGLALGGLVGLALPGRLGLAAALGVPAFGFLAPDLWLRRLARRRREALRRELPALLDLLRVAVAAGLPLSTAIATVARHGEGALAREWRALDAQGALGVPLVAALGDLRARMPFPEIVALTTGLGRALRHGSPLEDTLSSQAREAREARARAVRDGAARAGPKIQLVVALLLVPSVLLMVAAALVSALASSAGSLI